nr:MAG TPA: tail assembly chaperone protein [Caudoviricetes sp.]
MNLADALLAADAGQVTKKERKEYEVKRLSGILGSPFVLELKQIPNKRVREIQDFSMKINGRDMSVDQYKLSMGLLCDGIANKDFDNRDVLKHYGVATRKELFDVLFNAGEIQDIANVISDLCGFNNKKTEEQVDEVKN